VGDSCVAGVLAVVVGRRKLAPLLFVSVSTFITFLLVDIDVRIAVVALVVALVVAVAVVIVVVVVETGPTTTSFHDWNGTKDEATHRPCKEEIRSSSRRKQMDSEAQE
jgi:hypothetical protein